MNDKQIDKLIKEYQQTMEKGHKPPQPTLLSELVQNRLQRWVDKVKAARSARAGQPAGAEAEAKAAATGEQSAAPRETAVAAPPEPVHQPFVLDPIPEGWSLEWGRAQLQKLAGFDLYRLKFQELKEWEDVLAYRRQELVRRQPTLVRSRMVQSLKAGHGVETAYDPADAEAAWDYCETLHRAKELFPDGNYNEAWARSLEKRSNALTPIQKTISGALQQDWQNQLAVYKQASRQLGNLKDELEKTIVDRWKQELETFQTAYRAHMDSLPQDKQNLLGYEIGKAGLSSGHSGFHGLGTNPVLPFGACGWADYVEPGWGATEGVAFRINRDCFGGRDALLYYFDDEGFPGEEDEEEKLAIIRECSSGISCLRVDTIRDEEDRAHRGILFRLDAGAIRPTVLLSHQEVDTRRLGGYVFVLPRAGEFFCQLGEIVDGKAVLLHKDDFCMK